MNWSKFSVVDWKECWENPPDISSLKTTWYNMPERSDLELIIWLINITRTFIVLLSSVKHHIGWVVYAVCIGHGSIGILCDSVIQGSIWIYDYNFRDHSSGVEQFTFNELVEGSNPFDLKMSRSIWKGVNKNLIIQSNAQSTGHQGIELNKYTTADRGVLPIKSRTNSVLSSNLITVSRADMLIPDFLDKKVSVHTGNGWKTIIVKNIHIGQKAGEFAATKFPAIFKRNKRKIGRIKYGS